MKHLLYVTEGQGKVFTDFSNVLEIKTKNKTLSQKHVLKVKNFLIILKESVFKRTYLLFLI